MVFLLIGLLVLICLLIFAFIRVNNLNSTNQQKANDLAIENANLSLSLQHEKQQSQEKLELLQRSYQQLTETFKNLSNQALLQNNEQFLSLAKTSFEKFFDQSKVDLEQKQQNLVNLVTPVQNSLQKVEEKIGLLEQARIEAYSDLRRQVTDLLSTQRELRSETANLAKALRAPNSRGQWGEIQLKRVVEMAGMLNHCDFIEQAQSDDGRLKPDMVINLPGGKKIIVDAKAPLSAYLSSIEEENERERKTLLQEHARQVRAHIKVLSQRAYWEQFQPTPDFVVMFLPGEAFFSAALDQDPTLIEAGVQEKVILATPTTLIALLRAVAFGWRQEGIAENAKAISDLGKELYKRLGDMNDSLGKLGRNIRQAVDSYNQTIGTIERRVLVSARKLNQLDMGLNPDELQPINPLDSIPRTVQSDGEDDR